MAGAPGVPRATVMVRGTWTVTDPGAAAGRSVAGRPRPLVALRRARRGDPRGEDAEALRLGAGREDPLEQLARRSGGAGGEVADAGDEARDPDALVGDPLDPLPLGVARLVPDVAVEVEPVAVGVAVGDARVVERDHLPGVAEHRRPGRSGLGVAGVVRHRPERLRQGAQHALAEDHLLALAGRVLDDVDRPADPDLAFGADERQVAEVVEPRAVERRRRHRDEGEVEVGVGREQPVGLQPEVDRRDLDVGEVDLVAELRERVPRRAGAGQHVVVGHQHARRHEEAGAEAVGHPDAPDRAHGDGGPGDEHHRQVLLGLADHPLERAAAQALAPRRFARPPGAGPRSGRGSPACCRRS